MKLIYFSLLVLLPYVIRAQDPFFTQAYSNPLQLNPSFSGSMGCSRVILNNRYQLPNSMANYKTTAVSYDRHVNALHGGLGFTYLRDQAGLGYYSTNPNFRYYAMYNTLRLGLIYSPTFIIKKKISIKPSIETSFFQKSVDWSNLTFDDMIDRRSGFVYSTLETPHFAKKTGYDFSTGILINTVKWNCGVAIYHLTQPDEGLLTSSSLLKRKISAHASYTFSKSDSANFSFSPAIVFLRQGAHQLIMTTMNFKYKWLRCGIGIRSGGDKLLMIGTNLKRFTINYSYDLPPSDLYNTCGSHEVSIACLFKYKKKVKITEQVKDEQNPELTKEVEKIIVEPIKYNVIPLKSIAF
jgi:type IX secretion system PorP/SprF family membrane protein